MPNDIKKLRRLMRTAHVLLKGDDNLPPFERNKYSQSYALKQAWWLESFRDTLSNGFARFTYYKKDGTTRTAFGTRSLSLVPVDKLPKGDMSDGATTQDCSVKAITYFDLDKNEWRSFSVLNFVSLNRVWRFNDQQNKAFNNKTL